MRLENEFADDHVHNNIGLKYGLAEFLYKALRHEEKRLRHKIHFIEDHHELSWLTADSMQLEVYHQTYKWTGKFRQLFDELLRTAASQDEIQLGDMKHGMLRKLKAVGLDYIEFLAGELQQYGTEQYQAPPVYEEIHNRVLGLKQHLSEPPFDTVSPGELLP